MPDVLRRGLRTVVLFSLLLVGEGHALAQDIAAEWKASASSLDKILCSDPTALPIVRGLAALQIDVRLALEAAEKAPNEHLLLPNASRAWAIFSETAGGPICSNELMPLIMTNLSKVPEDIFQQTANAYAGNAEQYAAFVKALPAGETLADQYRASMMHLGLLAYGRNPDLFREIQEFTGIWPFCD